MSITTQLQQLLRTLLPDKGFKTAGHHRDAIIAGVEEAKTYTDEKASEAVKKTGNETIAGIKTFTDGIVGNVTGNASTVTNGVYTSGNQTIGGVKTFESAPVVPNAIDPQNPATKGQLDSSKLYLIKIINVIKGAEDSPSSNIYGTIRAAISAAINSSKSNQYLIKVHEGSYLLNDEYSVAEIVSPYFLGWEFQEFVSIEGVGNVILDCNLTNAVFDTVTTNRVSTITKKGSGNIENIVVKGTNVRYCVHDDYKYDECIRNVINCEFIKYEGLGFTTAYGAGVFSGYIFNFTNCKFVTYRANGNAFTCHNNVNFSSKSIQTFINCEFQGKTGTKAIRFGSMGSGVTDEIYMFNCRFGGNITLNEEVTNSGVGIDFMLAGGGNNMVPLTVIKSSTTPFTKFYFSDEISFKLNTGSSVTKGYAMSLSADGNGVTANAYTNNPELFYGIAYEDIPNGSYGRIKFAGYIAFNEIPMLITPTYGDKLIAYYGRLQSWVSGDYVGICMPNGYVKLKS